MKGSSLTTRLTSPCRLCEHNTASFNRCRSFPLVSLSSRLSSWQRAPGGLRRRTGRRKRARRWRSFGVDINDPLVSREFEGLEARMQENHQALKGISTRMIIKEIWSVPSCRNRFLLSAFMQTVAQWSGGNGITYYIVTVRLPPLFPPTHPSNHPCIPEYAFTNMYTDIPIRRPPRLLNLPPILRRIRPHKAPLHRPLRSPPNRPPGPP
jgi:hypothetical protein